MSGVHFCSSTNSTFFTDCCDVAITNEKNCPLCGKPVYPSSERGRWEMAMKRLFGKEQLQKMRAKYAKY